MKIKKTYRINEEVLADLDKLAGQRGVSQTEALEVAIRFAIQMPNTEAYGCHTQSSNAEVNALIRQLDVKDRQIDALTSALVAAQETAKAAQVLHAADKPELALESAEQKRTRWQRLMDAWRG